MTETSDVIVLEQSLFHEKNVWFYKVPAGQITSLAPRADAWNPDNPFLTGSVRVLQKGDACFVQLFEPKEDNDSDDDTPTLFAQCPLQITLETTLDVYVHDCVDSSRYFMLRMEDDQTGRRAFVGIGFPDRTAAFNFKATLQDYAKYAMRQLQAQQVKTVTCIQEQSAAGRAALKKSSLSLPDGATIRIKLRTKSSDDPKTTATQWQQRIGAKSGAANVAKSPLIPPPPRDSPVSVKTLASSSADTEPKTVIGDDDWGDFTSA